MATLIDSSVLIAADRGQLNFDEIATRYPEEDVAMSAVTASELYTGHRARTATQRHRHQAFVDGLIAQLPVSPSISSSRGYTLRCALIWPGTALGWGNAT
jgi:tRNA(fMet)-specific endonuclease VapC